LRQEVIQLVPSRELPEEQQECHFFEGRLVRQIDDGIAPVAEARLAGIHLTERGFPGKNAI
jgi:hypothetical protein